MNDQVYPESQCGFREQRSTTDMIFTVRQLQEKAREQNDPLYLSLMILLKLLILLIGVLSLQSLNSLAVLLFIFVHAIMTCMLM